MDKMTKEQLELLLKAFKVMEGAGVDFRKSAATIRTLFENEYVELIKKELLENKNK